MFVILRHIISRSAPSVQLFFWSILCELFGRACVTLPESDLVISIPVERLPLCLAIYRAFPLEESALQEKRDATRLRRLRRGVKKLGALQSWVAHIYKFFS